MYLKKGADINNIPQAVIPISEDVTKLKEVEYRPSPFIVQAAVAGDIDNFKIILGEGANLADVGFIGFSKKKNLIVSNALGAALYYNNFHIAMLILSECSETNDVGLNQITQEFKDSQDKQQLITKQGKIEFSGTTPMMLALHNAGDEAEQVVRFLKRNRADTQSVDSNGNSILHWMAKTSALKSYEYLQQNEVEMDYLLRNSVGETPLSVVEKVGSKDMKRILKRDSTAMDDDESKIKELDKLLEEEEARKLKKEKEQ
jgi:hypothetical protein